MKAISLDTSADHFIISIDKDAIAKEKLIQFIDNLRLESNAEQVNFQNDIEQLGEEIKATWWQENKDRFIPKGE